MLLDGQIDFQADKWRRMEQLPGVEQFIRSLPKAELHLHIEGTLEPEMAFELARAHGIRLPYATPAQLRSAYEFTDLKSFLEIYYAVADVLRDESDFYALTSSYLRRAHQQGVVHAEIFFDPQTHTARGIEIGTVIRGIHRALTDAERDLQLTSRLIPCFLRDLSSEQAMHTLEQVLPFRAALTAIGLDSSELGNPPSKFTAVFERARSEGLLTVAHAGEEGPASYIREALDLLHVQRIDHGVRCEQDPELVRRLARERIPLTMCPLSNVKLGVFDSIEAHNIKRLMDAGLCVSVNSDDPAYFGGYVLDNYLAIQRAFSLSRQDLARLAGNSVEASFLDAASKRHWIQRIDETLARLPKDR